MADYNIKLGVKLDKSSIGDQLKNYKASPIEVTAKLNTSKIDDKIKSYTAKKQIELVARLNTTKIDDKIKNYTAKKQIVLDAKLDTKNIDSVISSYQSKKPITLDVELNSSRINEQISAFKAKKAIEINAKLRKDAIDEQIRDFQTKVPIKVNLDLNYDDINKKIGAYEARSPLRVKVKIDKTDVNKQISEFGETDKSITVKAKLDNGAISEAIRNYKAKTPIKVDLILDHSDIDKKISAYKAQNAVELQARVRINTKDIAAQIQNYKPVVPIELVVTKFDTTDIDSKISSYKTSKAISVGVKLDNSSINQQIGAYKPNAQLNIAAKLDDTSIGSAIANYKPSTPLVLNVVLDAKDIDAQISAYKASVPVMVGVKIDTSSISEQLAMNKAQSPLQVNVKLDTQKINEQIRGFSSRSSIKVGVKLDSTGISNQIRAISTKTPVKVSLKLDISDAKNKINEIKRQLQQLSNVKIVIGGSGGGGTSGGTERAVNELNKIKLLAREIGKLDFKINTLDTTANVNQIQELERQLELLKIQYNETAQSLSQSGVTGIGSVTAKEFVDARNKLAEFEAKLTDTKNKLAQKITANFGNYDAELLSLQNRFKALANQPEEVATAIESVKQALSTLKSADGTEDIIAKNERYKDVLKQVETQLKNLELIENGSDYQDRLAAEKEAAMRKLNSLFSEGSAAAKKYGEAVEQLRNELNSCGNIKGVQNVNKKINALGAEIKRTSVQTQTLGERLKTQFSKYSAYFSVASLVMYAVQGVRDMFQQVKAIDSAMTELKKVTNETDASYNQFLNNAASRAKELGTTIDGLVSSTADFARLGYGFEEAQGLAEVANIYAVVGDEIDGVEGATQSLVSTMAAFKDEMSDMSDSEFALSIVDKMNEVSNNFAISSGGIGEALQRSASSMAAANNTIDETIAMITAANEVAQNPEKVGNAMKTMSMRIRGAKTELEEAGESTDGMAESTASLRQEIMALSGVDIMLNENTFKSTYQIMDELSQKWEGLSDIAQATIIELVAGKHQGNVFSSLMANFDTARKALDTSLNSSGSAMAEHAKWSESLEAHLNRLKAAWQGLSQSFLNSDFLKGSIDTLTVLVDIIDSIISKLGTFGTIGLGVGIFQMFKHKSGVSFILKELATFGSLAADAWRSGGKLTARFKDIGAAAAAAGGDISGKLTKSFSGVVGAVGLAIAAISLIVTAYKNYKAEISQARQETIAASDEFLDAAGSFEQAYIKYSGKTSLTSDEEAELAMAINGTVDALGNKTSALQNVVNSSNDYLASLEAIAKAELKEAESTAKAKKVAAEAELKDIVGANLGQFLDGDSSSVNVVIERRSAGRDTPDSASESEKIAREAAGKYYKLLDANKGSKYYGFELPSDADVEVVLDYYYSLVEAKNQLLENDFGDTEEYEAVGRAIDRMSEAVATYESGVYDAAKAQYQLTKGIPKTVEEYLEMRESILSDMNESGTSFDTRKAIANSLDSEYGQMFDLTSSKIQSRKLIGVLNEFGDNEAIQMEAFLNMRTAVNNDECSVGDYVSQFDEINKMTEGWSDQAKEELKLSFGFDTDLVKNQYDELLKELPDNIGDKTAEEFLGKLSKTELSAVYNLRGEIDWVNGSPSEILAQIEEQARLNEAMSFTFSIELQTESIAALNTALSESRSATGLTAESLSLLKSRYEDLEGFNAAALFENTAVGVRLNNEELARLESQYESVNKLDIDKNLSTLVEKYRKLTDEIKSCTDEKKKEKLQLAADNYATKIEELSTLASMYDGLTSSFSKWQNALSSPNNGDNYDAVFDNFEKVKELYDGGLVGTDDFKTFAQLMTSEDLSNASVDAYVSAYKNGLPIMQKYFAEGQEGCKNFLDDISNINSEWAHLNEDGNWDISFDAKDVAKELGISADAVLLIADKLKDYGFDIDIKTDYTSLDSLQTEIEKNEAKLKELGQTPVSVNLDVEATSQNIGTIESEISKLKDYISEVNNSSVEPDVKTAQLEDAKTKLEALIQKKQEASQPAFMKLDTSQVSASLVDALEKVQAYQTALNDLNKLSELKEAGISVDDSQVSAAQERINECAKAIQSLDEDVKLAIGLEEDGSIDSIKKSFEDGKVNIDANTDPAATKIERLVKEVDKIEDKDVTITVTVNGLDDVKELNRNIDLATNIDGDIDSLSEYVESAKALSNLGGNITSHVTASIGGNVKDTPEYMLNNLEVFADGAKELKNVGSFKSDVTANINGNVKDTPESSIDNLKVFSDNAKDVNSIGNVSSSVTANIDGNVIDTAEFKINNLKTYSDSAKDVRSIGNVESNITANIEGNVKDLFEIQIDNLAAYSESAKDIGSIGTVESSVTANIEGNVKDLFEIQIDNLTAYSESAKDIENIGIVESKVTANIEGNVTGMLEASIDNLAAYSESAKNVADIGDVSSSVKANITGNVTGMLEASIDNLKTYSDSAKDVAGIGDVSSSVTANVDGNVKNLFEEQIDNLKTYSDSAKDIGSIGDVSSSVTANVDGNVLDTFEYQINNLKVYADSAKDIGEIGTVDSSVTADVGGNVLKTSEDKINSLKVYADSAKKIDNIGDVSSSVEANIGGNVINTKEYKINNLKTYSDSAKDIANIGDVTSSVTADVNGNVVNTAEFKIDNLKSYSDSAKDVAKIGDVTSSVEANINGNVVDTAEFKINNLKTYSDSAKDVADIGNVSSSVTANVSGNVLKTAEAKINNLKTYSDSAKGVADIGNVSSSVTANVNGNVIKTSESEIDNIGLFADNASKLDNVGDISSNVDANANGNVITNPSVITNLEHFVSVVSGMTPNQTVTISVTADVDSANINQAINLLTNVANSGVFKDYSATVKVGATVSIVDDTAVQNYQAPDKDGTAEYSVDSSKVDAWKPPAKTGTVTYKPKIAPLTYDQLNKRGTITYQAKVEGAPTATGTAHSSGSASGHAFARGNWGIQGNGVALGGELGQELVVRDGKFFTIGDSGAEFFRYKKNDIVFNAAQTESLFRYGGIKGAKPRGKMLASGTAFVEGNAFAGTNVSGGGKFHNSVTGASYGSSGSGSDGDKESEEVIDWIEVIINRVERAIDKFDQQVNNIYKSWSSRNDAIINQTSKVREEIDLQQRAYDKYIEAANGVDLASNYAELVRNGAIDIETVTDEALKEKIEDYKKWYEKALDCHEAIEELKETEASLYAQRVEHVATQYEGILGVVEHEKSMIEEYINQSEAQAWLVSAKYYDALAKNERENIAELQNQKAAMLVEFESAMNSGTIAEGSESYYEMVASIDEVTLAITESQTALLEYEQSIQELDWEVFDLLQDKITAITDETEFLIELMSNDKLHSDNGRLTDEGKATMGLHGVAYNTYMHQADQAAAEAERLKQELAEDPYDTELEERYREMIALQQEYILAAEDERDAIKSLVEEGIELEIEALEERIDKYNEALDSQKDLYDYQKKVKEQTKEIASIEKQMAAYNGDTSEEARAKVQELRVSLEEAKADLEETEYDKYISDTEQMLDDLVLEYEETLNMRLDNIDALIESMIEEVNTDASAISDTIRDTADSVGYTLSDSMKSIWDEDATGTKNVITTYGDKFVTAQTTTNSALNTINTNLQNMISQLNTIAKTNTKSANTSSASKSSSNTKKTTTTTTTKTKKSVGDGSPKIGDKVKFVSGQYYYDSQGKKPLGSQKQGEYVYITNINKREWATHPYHISTGNKLGKGDLGWLKLNQISGYATGKKDFLNDEIAWTQEGNREFIVRPSDGAILTPIAKGDSVLTSAASNNIWDMANSPAEFIKNNLNLGTASVPSNSNTHSNYTQHLDKVVFNLPNVKNYDELLSAMQKDKNFEKLLLSMTIDQIAGKSSLGKGKSIR